MKTDGMDVGAVAVVRPSAWEGSPPPETPAPVPNGSRRGKRSSAPPRAGRRGGPSRNGAGGTKKRRNGR